MFESIEDAIKLGKGRPNDGGVPLFRNEAVERRDDPGRFDDVVFVMILNKGDPKSIQDRPKRAEDEKRWPAHWAAFQTGSDSPLDRTPLKAFPMLTPADIATCQRFHIRTVEDLADYPDVQLPNLGSRGTSLKNKAREFLEYRNGPDVGALMARVAELEKQIGNNTDNVRQRAEGNGVSDDQHTGRKQQSGRKNNTKAVRKKRKKAV